MENSAPNYGGWKIENPNRYYRVLCASNGAKVIAREINWSADDPGFVYVSIESDSRAGKSPIFWEAGKIMRIARINLRFLPHYGFVMAHADILALMREMRTRIYSDPWMQKPTRQSMAQLLQMAAEMRTAFRAERMRAA